MKAMAAVLVVLIVPLAGCSGPRSEAEASASASPSASAAVMNVDYGVDEINVAVGQSINFQTPGDVRWNADSSDEQIVTVIVPDDDVFTPDTPGGVAKAPGQATVTMTLPTGGTPWSVLVRVIGPSPSP